MEPQKKLLMIVNPRAGRSKPRGPLYDAAAALCDAGYLLRIRRTTAAGDAARIAAQEGGDYDTVVAVGGDGTLNEVISGIQTPIHFTGFPSLFKSTAIKVMAWEEPLEKVWIRCFLSIPKVVPISDS